MSALALRPLPVPDVLTLTLTARLVNLSAERFRKVWPQWVRKFDFPAPFKSPPMGSYAWRREAVEAWREARERALGAAAPTPRPRSLDPLFAHKAAVARQRALARTMMEEA